jgi:upstream activation factor subunit UAF30
MAKKKSGGINAKFKPDAKLAAVIGKSAVTRGQAVKKFWEYVKGNDLQDPNDGRVILSDDALYALSGKKKINMLQVSGVISKHLKAE